MRDGEAPVVIVGAGFSGTMVAANLARLGLDSLLVDSKGRAGLGTAFSTEDPAHLLNIPADNMGAWPDSPGDFAASQGIRGESYAERRHFGRYLRSILGQALDSGHARLVEGRAVGAERDGKGWKVRIDDGETLRAGALVLAIGNQPPAAIEAAEPAGRRLIGDPWGESARAAIDDAAARQLDVLVLGSSLTMVDVALSLESAGHRARTLALSRRGKVPLGNGIDEPSAVEWDQLPPPRIRAIAKWLRERSQSLGWRAAVDSLRPHSHRLWQSLPSDEKRRFLRFGRPWWDIHRHRIAPQVAAKLDELVASGRLEVVAGRLLEVRPTDDGVEVRFRRRGRDSPDSPRRFGYIFNCTGPLGDIGRTGDPLLRQLLDEGAVRPDELAIGLAVDERCRPGPGERLWALGALTKGRYWEMIAVPDIRHQAAMVAEDIATELGR